MHVIGLTGNIATGKSTVAEMLRRMGALVIDADKLAHRVMGAGTDVHRRILQRFGRDLLGPDGEIDRARLGGIVFADPGALRDLERIVHPRVVEKTLRLLRAAPEAVGVVEAIKLIEADMHRYCDAVWVVTSSREQQMQRLKGSRYLTCAEAALRIDTQPPVAAKLAMADEVIDNSEDLEDTWEQVRRAWRRIPKQCPGQAGSSPLSQAEEAS